MGASQDKYTGKPPELTQRPAWVLWKLQASKDDPEGEPTKVPYTTHGTKASATDALTWAPFETVAAELARGSYSGLGYVFSSGDPYTGIDFDDCFTDQGTLKPWADEHVRALTGLAYIERSQSGKGLHCIIRGKARVWHGKHIIPDRGEGKDAIEVYSTERFFVMTGDVYGPTVTRIGEAQAELNTLCHALKPKEERQSGAPRGQWSTGLSDEAVLDVVTKHYGRKFTQLYDHGKTEAYKKDHSSADMGLVGMLAYGCGPNPKQIDRLYRQSKLNRAKWDEARGGSTYGADTIARVLKTREPDAYYGVKAGAPQFTILTPPELKALPPAEWLIDDVLVKGTVNVLYGAPGTYKSFLVLDMAYSIALGKPWQGHKTKPGSVLIVTPETIETQKDRLAALEIANKREIAEGLDHIPHAVSLLSPAEVKLMCDTIAARGTRYSFVVFDTLAQAMAGGDENSPKDMGTAMGHLQELAKCLDATLLVIHHVTKATGKLRGNSGLNGAVATQIKVEAADELVTVMADKGRHSGRFEPITLKARAVPIPNGLTATSLVFESTSEEMPRGTGNQQRSRADQALAILKSLSPEGDEVPNTDWQSACIANGIPKPSYDDAKRQLTDTGKVIKRMERNRAFYRPAPPTKIDAMGWGDDDE